MNHTFSLTRISLLFTRFFTEHWRRDLITLSAYFIAFALLPRLISFPLPIFPFILFCAILFIGGMHFSARIFHEVQRPSSGMHYLHIPAGRAEKFFVNGVLTLILYPALCFLLLYAATLFANLLEPVIPAMFHYRTIDISTLIPASYTAKILKYFLSFQAVFFMGSLIFKKHPTTKTVLSVIVFHIALGIVQSLLTKLCWGDFEITSVDAFKEKIRQLGEEMLGSRILPYVTQLFFWVTVIFFWIVSYLKFKEKEV